MINRNAIIEWGENVPWKSMRLIEQDLVISRVLVSIFQDDYLCKKLAFRGGTAIYKLFLRPPARYSEDIDLVQIDAEPIGETLDRIKNRLAFLGEPKTKRKQSNNILLYRFEAHEPQGSVMQLKIEINCREHMSVFGRERCRFEVKNQWFSGDCEVETFCFNELIGTKLRALYQRKKGRDIFDVYRAIKSEIFDATKAIECFTTYMAFQGYSIPSATEYEKNLHEKMLDQNFRDDILPILAAGIEYDIEEAYKVVKEEIIAKM